MVYGQRDEPYAVIEQLGRRLEDSFGAEMALSMVVETLAQALKLPYVALTLNDGERFALAAACGAPVAQTLTLPLTYQGEPVGQLIIAPRRQGETFAPADRRLLAELARQVGVAAHTVRLTTDLQRSREQLVMAREEERRRLRRDLHDGLGPTLAALALKAATVSELIGAKPSEATQVANELYADIRGTVGEIRRLVYALRPPRLDEVGLVEAIRELARQTEQETLRVTVEGPESLPPLSAAVEVAAYRIAQETLTNVVRHASARVCAIRLAVTGNLRLEIEDDGVGIAPEHHIGVGLHSLRERAAELGGSCVIESTPGAGVHILACLPLVTVAERVEPVERGGRELEKADGSPARGDR